MGVTPLHSLDAEAETSPRERAGSDLVCDVRSFRPAQTLGVRWLDIKDDFALLPALHETRDPSSEPFTWPDAVKWKKGGFTDAGIIEGGVLVSRTALWTYSEDAWELARSVDDSKPPGGAADRDRRSEFLGG